MTIMEALNLVRSSCINLKCEDQVTINLSNIDKFVETYQVSKIREIGTALAQENGLTHFKLNFGSLEQEVSFIVLTHALDFGSGFRKELHAFHQKGAWNTLYQAMYRMFEENKDFERSWLKSLSKQDIIRMFLPGLPEENLPLNDLAEKFQMVCNEIGTNLEKKNLNYLYQLVFQEINNGANGIVQLLVDTFPNTFNDAYDYDETQKVFFYKKAQLVTGELFHRFRKEDERFNFKDGILLTPYVDNVIVATMRKTGCIESCEAINESIEKGKPILRASKEEIALRAKALHAIALIAKKYDEEILECEIGNFLWAYLGKVPDFRSYNRHATPDTVFY